MTRLVDQQVPDAVYDQAHREFSEAELAQLTLGVIVINGWNRKYRIPHTGRQLQVRHQPICGLIAHLCGSHSQGREARLRGVGTSGSCALLRVIPCRRLSRVFGSDCHRAVLPPAPKNYRNKTALGRFLAGAGNGGWRIEICIASAHESA